MSVVVTDPSFQEDYESSIIIDGPIDSSLTSKVAPRVLDLRGQKTRKITVYINSNGGHTMEADAIFRLLKFRGNDDYSPWVVTVAFGNAKSAAADMLAMGDYAIAYPNASIHFHGVRYADVPELTMEDASQYSEVLSDKNSAAALRLANAAFGRTVLLYLTQYQQFNEVRKKLGKPDLRDSECFFSIISEKLYSDSAKRVVKTALGHFNENNSLSGIALTKANAKPHKSTLEYELRVFHSVVAHLTSKKEDKLAGLTNKKLTEITTAFKLLRDYHLGPHTALLKNLVSKYGTYFLTPDETKHYESLQAGPKDEMESWLEGLVSAKIRDLWYLVVSTWQALQEDENPLTPSDAYWLGVVDEVAGTDLAALRILAPLEIPDHPAIDPFSSTAPLPPS